MSELESGSEDLISIGRVRRAVGLDGAVEVELYSGDAGRVSPGRQVTAGGRGLVVAASRPGRRGSVTVRFEDVSSRDDAEALTGLELEAPRSSLPQAAEGYYYHFEIIGSEVRDLEGRHVGRVSGIMETGANDVYVVERPGGPELLIPAVRDVVKAIDTTARIITIDPPRGLIE